MNVKFTEGQKSFIRANYAVKGSLYCSDHLKIPREKVTYLANLMGVKLSMESHKNNYDYKVDPVVYKEPKQPEFIYFLGYLWADGWVSKDKNVIRIGLAKSDGDVISEIFSRYCRLRIYEQTLDREKNGNCQIRKVFEMTDKYFADFLKANDYCVKSWKAPTKILSIIPIHLRHYWWRGYFDGDGCISRAVYPTWTTYRVKFSGSSDQDWTSLYELYKDLEIISTLDKESNSLGKWSSVYFHRPKYISRFLDYIYPPQDIFHGCLVRKYARLQEARLYAG